MIDTCYTRTVNSVIMSVPDLEELYNFKRCIRKYGRTKMRVINYYKEFLIKKDEKEAFIENINLL